MLRRLFRYALLPIITFLLLGYAAIPLWVPSIATMLLEPANLQEIELKVGYPNHERWHINHLGWRQASADGTLTASLSNVSLAYTWQSIKDRKWPYFRVGEASGMLEKNPKGQPLIPSIALIPSQWLPEWPKFKVDKFNLELNTQGQQLALTGELTNHRDGLSILSKISIPNQQQIYLDATLGADDKVDATLFTTQDSAPVAKITSNITPQGNSYVWQGQGALNLAYAQLLLHDLLPIDLAQTTITQGKLSSYWKITLPADIDDANHADFDSWLNQAQGELQSQIQLAASHPNLKQLNLDASLTQTLNPNTTPVWRLNEGSTVRVSPAWDNTKIDPSLYQSLLLEKAQLTFSADSPVRIESIENANFLGENTSLRLHGDINATLENTHSVYQVFGQLSELQVHSLNHWQGLANVSGYYLAQSEANPWMAQLPIDLRQLQFLSSIAFDFDPKQWQFKVQPGSKISATQVESRRQAGSVQLFASDKLNLTNDQTIPLAYLPEQDYWTWSNASVHLRPESIPSQGLEINFGAGSTLLSNQPVQGSFKLRPTSVNLPDWPSFQMMSTGQLNWLDGQLNINFTSELPPYISTLEGQYLWHADTAEHQLLVQVKAVQLAPLIPQLKQLENALELPAPLLANVTRGWADYDADWRWTVGQLLGAQTFTYSKVDVQSDTLHVMGLSGKSQFDYHRKRNNSKPLDMPKGELGEPITTQLKGTHQFKADQLSWGTGASKKLLRPTLVLGTKGWSEVTYDIQKIEAGWLGGRVLGQGASIRQARLNTVPISLQNIQLAGLIKLAETPNLNATGEVSGRINMTLDLTTSDSLTWAVADADLSSTKMGTINYTQSDTKDVPDKVAYLQEILSEFQFQHLSAQLTHNEEDKLQLLTRFVGSNKSFEAGKKVDFSLTLNPQLH
jgi:hypothetical protein|tara:strand:- start:825 stop:3548 length:2724 start_codon:yes stop_codon:yes gene_type:complete